ncbi:GGDEF: diguanylate cyclase (GGDEF) domain-containing protein [Gaiella occulta]|uniref:GGDEF: diguanylate cyclase (GGDEF) domain-containing protein n=2 Tax=Gaiella occulta TaxID=1002870 RepID=A0A7M2YXP6_9ACTN|nr:GGDEF: diguanylate cyclase (GGDEF) domain-containing protein [Gaiella occulta]
MDALACELADALDRLREEARRARAVEALGGSLDLDEVLARVADAAAALPGAAASIVRVQPPDGEPLLAASGIDVPPGSGHVVGVAPDGAPVRAVALSYHYRPGSEPADPLRTAIAVPLAGPEGPLGFVTVFGRGDGTPLGSEGFAALEAIAAGAAPAIDNARRRRAAGRHEAIDPLTRLGSRTAFHDALAREVARAHRSGSAVTVLVVDIDGLRALNEEHGHLAGDDAVRALGATIAHGARRGDIVCRIGGGEFGAILPDGGRIEAEAQFARMQAALGRRSDRRPRALSISAGMAELGPDDDAVSLLARAQAALKRAKERGRGTAAEGRTAP